MPTDTYLVIIRFLVHFLFEKVDLNGAVAGVYVRFWKHITIYIQKDMVW